MILKVRQRGLGCNRDFIVKDPIKVEWWKKFVDNITSKAISIKTTYEVIG